MIAVAVVVIERVHQRIASLQSKLHFLLYMMDMYQPQKAPEHERWPQRRVWGT